MPAPSSTRRCLLIACRVRREPCASCEIERGDPATSVVTRPRRVASPSAANTAARPSSSAALDMGSNVLHLLAPSPVIHAVGLKPPRFRNGIEARFADDKERPLTLRRKPEFHPGGRLLAVIKRGVDGVGMPGEGEQTLGLHGFDHDLPFYMFVARIGDLGTRHPPYGERRLELDAKPRSELAVVGQRAPDARDGCLELDLLFNPIGHAQPPGCRSIWSLPGKCATLLLPILHPSDGQEAAAKRARIAYIDGVDFGLNR